MRNALGAVLALSLVSCVPDRDNPFDPSVGRLPLAVVTVAVVGPDGVQIPGIEGTRQTTFAFDASSSVSPVEAPLTWSWQTSRTDCSSAGTFAPNVPDVTPTFATTLPLTADMIPTAANGEGAAVWNVCVRVREGQNGPAAIAQVQVVVRNRAPQSLASEDWFVSPGVLPTQVTLDACGQVPAGRCDAYDPDGDPLVYQWIQVGGTDVSPTSLDASGRRIRFTPLPSPPGYRFEVRMSDGLSTTSKTITAFSESALWYATDGPARLFRVYPGFRVAKRFRNSGGTLTPWSQLLGGALDPQTGALWISQQGGPTRQFDSSFNEVRSFPAYGRSLTAAGPNLCLAGTDSSGSNPGIYVLRPPATMTRVVASQDVPGGKDRVVSDGAGGCWTMTLQSGDYELGHVDAATGVYQMFESGLPQPTSNILDFIVPTMDGGAWLALGFLGANPAYSGLLRLWPDGTLQVINNEGAEADIDGLAVAPDGATALVHRRGEFGPWYEVASDGSQAAIDELPTMLNPGPTASDIPSGSVWLADQSGFLFRCEKTAAGWAPCRSTLADGIDGDNGMSWVDVVSNPTTGTALSLFANPTGAQAVALVPPHLLRSRFVPLPVGPKNVGPKLSAIGATGGTWYSDEYYIGALGMQSYTAEGRVVLGTAGLLSFPRPEHVTATLDGGAWAFIRETGNHRLGRFDPEGAIVATIDLGMRDQIKGLAVGSDGTVCFGTNDVAGTAQELFRVPPDGSLQSLGAGYFRIGTPTRPAVSSNGACWFSGSDIATGLLRIVHFAPGAPTPDVNRFENVAGRIGEKARIAADPRDGSVWVAVEGALGTGADYFLERIAANGVLTQSFGSSPGWTESIFDIALRSLCSDAANPACLETWQITGGFAASLLRTDGRVDQPLESEPIGGAASALTIAP